MGSGVVYPSLQQLLIAGLCLVIPVAIVLGHRRPNGPIVVCGGAACGTFVVFWLLLGGINSLSGVPAHFLVSILTFFGGMLLLLAAWALALSAAAQARRWLWVALLTAAGYLSVVTIFFSVLQPNPCIYSQGPGSDSITRDCTTSSPLVQLLVIAGYVAGPAASLAYGLRPDGLRRRVHTLPEGVSISSLRATSDPSVEN